MSFDQAFEGKFGVFATKGFVFALFVEATIASDDGGGELEDDGFDRVGRRPAFRRQKLHANRAAVQNKPVGEGGGGVEEGVRGYKESTWVRGKDGGKGKR